MAAARNRSLALQQLYELEIDYWHEVDFNWGRNASAMYLDDGLFSIGDSTMKGRDAIAEFYRWREGRGARTARHVVTNARLQQLTADSATLRCILLLYAADGVPVLPSLPAILIADVLSECSWCDDGRLRFRSHVLSPVFTGGEQPTVPPGQG
jgi:hypothetical protein